VPKVHLLDPGQLNTYDVLVSDHVIFTRAALDAFLARTGYEANAVESGADAATDSDAVAESNGDAVADTESDQEAEK
jgi:large subunit ribosomal protein L4